MSGDLLTLTHKLGIKEDRRVLLLDPPAGFAQKLDPLPRGASVATRLIGHFDVIVVFSSSRAVLGELFPKARHVMAPRGVVRLRDLTEFSCPGGG